MSTNKKFDGLLRSYSEVESVAHDHKLDGLDRSVRFNLEHSPRFSEHPAMTFAPQMRQSVFEIIVRHALVSDDWRQNCSVPLQTFQIMPEEIEAEVYRRVYGHFS